MKKTEILESIISKLLKGKIYKIVFIGDSITSTEWVHPNWREIVEYVLKYYLCDRFEDWTTSHWNIRCINAGLNGGGTDDFLKYIEKEILTYKPDLVFCIGTDADVSKGMSAKVHSKNVAKIKNILSKNVPYYVFGTDIASGDKAKNASYLLHLKEVKKLKINQNEVFINLFREFQNYDPTPFFTFMLPKDELGGREPGSLDYVHPNSLGNAYLAKILLQKVFGISFNPEKYIEDTIKGKKYPRF